jgi:hypothetical protein
MLSVELAVPGPLSNVPPKAIIVQVSRVIPAVTALPNASVNEPVIPPVATVAERAAPE